MRLPALAALLMLVLLSGCTDFYSSQQLPEWIVNRTPLESCGAEDLSQAGDALNIEARACVFAAFQAGDGAELISTSTTEEGDPITTYYRVHENGTVEIFVDATRDAFGSGRWERYRCDRLLPSDSQVFAQDGCEELPIP